MLLIGMKNIHVQNPIGILSLLANPGLTWSYCSCWFARDVMAAMLVIKNKSISLRWELNAIFMQILQEKFYCIDHQYGRLVTWLQTKNS